MPTASSPVSHPPPGAVDWLRLADGLVATGRPLRRALATLAAPLQVDEQELALLAACVDAPQAAQGQAWLANALGVSPALVSQLTQRLHEQGRLAPHRAAEDRRRQIWEVTPDGRALLAEFHHLASQLLARLEAALPDDERRRLCALLQRLTAALAARHPLAEAA